MVTTLQDIESRLSYAYLHAVTSAAGYICRAAMPDEDKEGIDAVITAYGDFPKSYRTQITINIQLKATIGKPADSGKHLSYFIKEVRRYDKLREDHREPIRLLMVLFLPKAQSSWLKCIEQQLILKKCAYWVSVRNAPASTNGTGQTVKIPKEQMLTPRALQKLVKQLVIGNEIPEYLVP